MIEKRFRFQHVNELTGLLVLGVLGLVVAGVIFSGHSQRWFSRKYAFEVLLPETGTFGLRRGDEVFISGVSVGWVNDVLAADDGRMRARVKIRGDFARFLRSDSTASLKKVFGVAGDSFMEITRGTNAPLPAHGATITCLSTEELPDRVERMLEELRSELLPVVRKTRTTLDEWTQLGADLRHLQTPLHHFVARLDHLATGLEQGQGTVGQLLTDTTLADDAHKLLARANETLGGLQTMMTNLNATVKNIQDGTQRLPEIAAAAANEAKDLPGLVRQTQTSMRELERLIEAMQRHWLLRKYVNQTNPPPREPPPATQEPKPPSRLRSPRDSAR